MRKAAGSLLAWGFLGALGVVLRRASNEARKLRAMDAAPFDFAPRPATPRAGRTEDDLTDDELVARVQAQVEVPSCSSGGCRARSRTGSSGASRRSRA
jgi:hypothetical protein